MSTIGTLSSAFQVKTSAGLRPDKQFAELSDRSFERKWPSHAKGTKLASRPFTRGTTTPLAA